MTIEHDTYEQIERIADTIQLASPERVRDELWKTLCTPQPDKAIRESEHLGLLRTIMPEVTALMGVAQSAPHCLDVYEHTLATMRYAVEIRQWLRSDQVNREPETDWQAVLRPWRAPLHRHFMQTLAGGRLRVDWLVWHAMLHDVGKPATQSEEVDAEGAVRLRFFEHESVGATMAADRLTFLCFSRQEIALSKAVIGAHMRPHHLHASFEESPISKRALYRYVRDIGGRQDEGAAIDTAMLALADLQATGSELPASWPQYLDHIAQIVGYVFDDQGRQDVRRRPLVDGHTLMAHLNMGPGRDVGELMEKLMEAQAAGDIETVDEALGLAFELRQEMET